MGAPIKPQSFLSNLPLFKDLGADEVERIAAGTREVHAARGERSCFTGAIRVKVFTSSSSDR